MSATAESAGHIEMRGRTAPSKAWYWLAAAVVALGIGCGLAWAITSTIQAHDRAESLPRTGLPGTLRVTSGPGASNLIFFEGEGRPSPETLGLTVTAADGSPVAVKSYDLVMDYEIAGWTASPIASFSAPVRGTYLVSATAAHPDGRIAVGDNFVRTQAVGIAGAVLLILGSVTAGVLIALVVVVRRASSRRRA